MFNNNEYLNRLAHQQRHQELVRRADHERLVNQLPASRSVTIRLYRPALAALGRWLVLSGTYLQRKSGVTLEAPRRIQPSVRGV